MATSEKSSSSDFFYEKNQEKMNRKESDHVEFSKDEEELIVRMYKLVGERWTLIAGRIPGRSAEEIEKYWVSRYPRNGFGK